MAKTNKELHKIKLLVAVVKDSGATENEKSVSANKIIKFSRDLINQAGFDALKMENWVIAGYMRFLFENNRLTLNNQRDKEEIKTLKQVLEFHGISFKHTPGNFECFERIVI